MLLVDKFFNMEEDCRLFDLKTDDGLPLWDIIRMHVYLKYHFPEVSQPETNQKKSLTDIWQHLTGLIKSILYLFTRKSENFILPTSRYLDSNGLYYDKAAMNVIEYFGEKNCFILEWHVGNKKYRYPSANNYVGLIQKFWKPKEKLSKTNFELIEKALLQHLDECRVSYDEIDQLLTTFRAENFTYNKLLKFKKIKRVFITQNGLQKGLIKAAKDNGIKVYEFQHGSFEKDHLAYSYPETINYNSNIIFPDLLLTFSEYWGSYFNVPAKKIVPVGNDYFNNSIQGYPNADCILVISSIIHGHELAPLTIELAKTYPDKQFKFKLHSNEYYKAESYIAQFTGYNNITIVKDEISISELLSQSVLVLLINSTVIYEALNQQRKVVIYKRGNYFNPNQKKQFANLFFINESHELSDILKAPNSKSVLTFFKPFNTEILSTNL